jgi:hypothetical protein
MIKLIPIILLLAACSNDYAGACPSALPVTISVERSDYPESRIRWAANFWNRQFGQEIIKLGRGGQIEIFEVNRIEYLDCHDTSGCAAPVVDYRGKITSCLIYIRAYGAETGTSVLIHELGHCLGLDHDSELESIMYPVIFPGNETLPRHIDHLSSCME